MRQFSKLYVLVALSVGVNLANAAAPARVDADRLASGMSANDDSAFAIADRHYLAGYMAGVADATEGKAWCSNGKIKAGEIDSEVLGELRKMPGDMLKENAATLIGRVLKQKFPCRH